MHPPPTHTHARRDLKLENVLVASDGHLKLGDFGLAKKVNMLGVASIGPKKERNTIIGTVQSMAPEVFTDKNYGRRARAARYSAPNANARVTAV